MGASITSTSSGGSSLVADPRQILGAFLSLFSEQETDRCELKPYCVSNRPPAGQSSVSDPTPSRSEQPDRDQPWKMDCSTGTW